MVAIASLYIDFIDPTYRYRTWENLQFTFQPETRFIEDWNFYEDPNNIGFSYSGNSKEQFMEKMWELHKHEVWKGYYYVDKYLLLFFILFKPGKKRVRFDRKRGIVYTYVGKKFYITELNKLMRPFPEYISAVNATLFIWVHPYRNKGTGPPCFRGPQITVVDRSAWLPMLGITLLPFLKEEFVKFNTAPYLKKVLVDFMNPDTPQERIDEILNTISGRKGIFEWLFNLMFNWINGGLYCKKLPQQAFLEEKLPITSKKDPLKSRGSLLSEQQ